MLLLSTRTLGLASTAPTRACCPRVGTRLLDFLAPLYNESLQQHLV